MLQSTNPALNIFQEIPINLKSNSSQFICSVNKKIIGTYNYEWKKGEYDGEICIFLLKEYKLVEYFRVKIKSKQSLNLLCFTNNDTQLLFYRLWTNSIECVNFNQKNILGSQTHPSETQKTFFQFKTEICFQVAMMLSNDQKMILIQTEDQYFLVNVTQLAIIEQYGRQRNDYLYRNIFFLDSTYIIKISMSKNIDGTLEFYNIISTKLQKILKLKTFQNSIIYQFKYSRSLALTAKRSMKIQQERVFATILNMLNLKLVRKVLINNQFEDNTVFVFLGYSQQHLFHKLQVKNNQSRLCIFDLFNLNFEIKQITKDCHYENNILKLTDSNSKNSSYWISK